VSSSATRAASIALGGVLADLVGIRAVYALGGGVLILAGVIGLSRLRRRDLVPVRSLNGGADRGGAADKPPAASCPEPVQLVQFRG